MLNVSRIRSRASEPLLKHVNPMKSPVGAPNTWPVPSGSTRGCFIKPKIVSLVPSEIATTPSRTRPTPTRLHGLSPDQVITDAGGNRCRTCQYGDSVPATAHDGAMSGSFDARSGAVACTASDHHVRDSSSIRFIPDPSPGSIGASPPMSNDARNELTRWMRPVRRYASGSVHAN